MRSRRLRVPRKRSAAARYEKPARTHAEIRDAGGGARRLLCGSGGRPLHLRQRTKAKELHHPVVERSKPHHQLSAQLRQFVIHARWNRRIHRPIDAPTTSTPLIANAVERLGNRLAVVVGCIELANRTVRAAQRSASLCVTIRCLL